jgi:putative DNA primase/helicase
MKAARWVADNAGAIRACDPNIPDAIFNRAADNWEPLLAVAEVAGGDIPERARQVALAACGVEEEQAMARCFWRIFVACSRRRIAPV